MLDNITIVRAVYSGISQRRVANAHKVSRNTIALLLQHARDQGWLTLDDLKLLDEAAFVKNLPTVSTQSRDTTFKMPDYDYVHCELAKPYVTLKLLWEEYVKSCPYGYLLEIYDEVMNLIRTWTISDGRHGRFYDDKDYKAIASRVPSSIPEIQRVFESTFPHGKEFYALASRVTTQPFFHAKEFLKLLDLHEMQDLDLVLVHCIKNNVYKIEDMRRIIKEKFFELVLTYERTKLLHTQEKKRKERYSLKNEEALVRNLTYY